ncbi:MAG: hypothetical protein LAP87_10770 [Acidobacteriia bacterium]|nr:hypothetical protein [Terriglobia bacterium]
MSGRGFSLTTGQNGVDFDFFGNLDKIRIAWTAQGSDNAWLVLDGNQNGLIDSAKEMFGNLTPQPKSTNPNGFLALAVFDRPEYGGNADGIIDARDSIYSSLRLWIDKNHNGISEPGELFTLPELDVLSISLDYKLSERVDEFGNRFRYRSTIRGMAHSRIDRVIYDVFLVAAKSTAVTASAPDLWRRGEHNAMVGKGTCPVAPVAISGRVRPVAR